MYPLIRIPDFANKDIYAFSKEEAKEYFKWFLSIKSERIQILESEVKKMHPEWKADYTRNSLIKLYQWFECKVKYRDTTEEEKEVFKNGLSKTPLYVDIIEIPKSTLTDETVSICFDICVYFAETVIFNVEDTKWIQKINSTNYIDYAQPIISAKTSKVPFNPRRIIESMATSILDNSKKLFSFTELFDVLFVKL